MVSQRLTKTLKHRVIQNLLMDAFTRRWELLKEDEVALALKVRDEALGEHAICFQSLPRHFVDWASTVTVRDSRGRVYRLSYSKGGDATVSVPRFLATSRYLPESRGLLKGVESFLERREQLIKDTDEARLAVRTILDSVTTTKRLLEVWPEVEKYLPGEGKPVESKALVPPVSELNKKIDAWKGEA